MSTDRVRAVLGTGTFGTDGHVFSKVTTPEEAQKYVDVLVKHGHSEVDTARIYGFGTSEELISRLYLKGATVDTKIYPAQPEDFIYKGFMERVQESVKALNGVKIRTLYLHNPDRKISVEDTLSAVDELHKQGVFEYFGLSNFLSYEYKGYVQPTFYQGIYNCLDRVCEAASSTKQGLTRRTLPSSRLFSCLRKYNIRFAAYSPLAGGFLTGFHLEESNILDSNTRFNANLPYSSYYIARYSHSIPVLRELKALGASDKHGIPLGEMAVRWLVHHSKLKPSDVGVLYGASKVEQLETALTAHAKGPLPDEVTEALAEAWLKAKAKVPNPQVD